MSIRTWNIQRVLERKLNDSNFVSILKGKDINILTECWFTKQFNPAEYDINEFHVIVVERTKCIGGGICIMIKKQIKHKIILVRTTEDSRLYGFSR